MYCPNCALQNSDDVKFCRVCGANLELVALALAGKVGPVGDVCATTLITQEVWQKKYGKSIRDLTAGSGYIIASLLLLFVPLHFAETIFPWLILWSLFFGWMTIHGLVELANGIGAFAEYRTSRREREISRNAFGAAPILAAVAGERVTAPDLSDSAPVPPSITESTTRRLQ